PSESPPRGPRRRGGPTDLAVLYGPGNPIRLRTEAEVLAALEAGPMSHTHLYREMSPEIIRGGFLPLVLADLRWDGRVRSEPGSADGLPILSLAESEAKT